MNMEAGNRQVEGARGCHLQVSQGLHELMRLLQGSCSMLLSSSFLRDKSNQAGPWLDCDHQGTCKEKGKKTKDEALRCINIQMIRRGWGGGHETKTRGQGWRRRRRRNSFSWKKKKKQGNGKDPNGHAQQSWKPPYKRRPEDTQKETVWMKVNVSRGLNLSPSGYSMASFLLSSSVKWVKYLSGFLHRVKNSPLPSILAHKGLNVKKPVLPTSCSLRLDLNFQLPWTALSSSS